MVTAFPLLVFVHFFVDWIFQSHDAAMRKHNDPLVRAKHCLIYTAGFAPVLLLVMHMSFIPYILSLAVLFFSHYVEDTYYPVYLWARYIRKPPCMRVDPRTGFKEFISTPLGLILMIAVDQIIHISFLWAVVGLSYL